MTPNNSVNEIKIRESMRIHTKNINIIQIYEHNLKKTNKRIQTIIKISLLFEMGHISSFSQKVTLIFFN